MRKFKPWVMLLLAISSGGLAAYLALRYLREQASSFVVDKPTKGRILLATRALTVGHVIGDQDIKVVNWPADAVPEGYLGTPEDAVGRGVIVPLRLNEPMLDTKLASRDAGGGLPVAIDEGMRAISVRVDEVISVAGFVVPGTRVDVLLTMASVGTNPDATTRVILQNVQTLAAGQSVEKDKDGKPQAVSVITVLATPEQAEALALASNQGKIQLALRNTLDTLNVQTDGVRASSLLGLRPVSAPSRSGRVIRTPVPTPRGAETIIEGYNGGVRTLLKF